VAMRQQNNKIIISVMIIAGIMENGVNGTSSKDDEN
jgi:hypothetical protein